MPQSQTDRLEQMRLQLLLNQRNQPAPVQQRPPESVGEGAIQGVQNFAQGLAPALQQRRMMQMMAQAEEQARMEQQEAYAQKLQDLQPLADRLGFRAETVANMDASTINKIYGQNFEEYKYSDGAPLRGIQEQTAGVGLQQNQFNLSEAQKKAKLEQAKLQALLGAASDEERAYIGNVFGINPVQGSSAVQDLINSQTQGVGYGLDNQGKVIGNATDAIGYDKTQTQWQGQKGFNQVAAAVDGLPYEQQVAILNAVYAQFGDPKDVLNQINVERSPNGPNSKDGVKATKNANKTLDSLNPTKQRTPGKLDAKPVIETVKNLFTSPTGETPNNTLTLPVGLNGKVNTGGQWTPPQSPARFNPQSNWQPPQSPAFLDPEAQLKSELNRHTVSMARDNGEISSNARRMAELFSQPAPPLPPGLDQNIEESKRLLQELNRKY
jgi:hypothetical protein